MNDNFFSDSALSQMNSEHLQQIFNLLFIIFLPSGIYTFIVSDYNKGELEEKLLHMTYSI